MNQIAVVQAGKVPERVIVLPSADFDALKGRDGSVPLCLRLSRRGRGGRTLEVAARRERGNRLTRPKVCSQHQCVGLAGRTCRNQIVEVPRNICAWVK